MNTGATTRDGMCISLGDIVWVGCVRSGDVVPRRVDGVTTDPATGYVLCREGDTLFYPMDSFCNATRARAELWARLERELGHLRQATADKEAAMSKLIANQLADLQMFPSPDSVIGDGATV